MGSENTVVHLLAGGLGGTAGAVITCPLEVVKTRLQSSVAQFGNAQFNGSKPVCIPGRRNMSTCVTATTQTAHNTSIANTRISAGLWTCLKHIVQHEGPRGLFKGLGPNLVGVAPSRAIYFCAYDSAKRFFNNVFVTESPSVHICSAAFAGFTASTTTNPIWFIKTRLQLDQKRSGSLTVTQCIRTTFAESGIRGFYRGITASYYGISETVIHFVIYEAIKAHLREQKAYNGHSEEKGTIDFIEFMGAGAVSKTIATCVAYPHEVARTRLRQSGDKYHRFWQTLAVVLREEGVRGLYRGLATQLVRQIPNTAIMMSTYEAVVYLCSRQLLEIDPDDDY